MKAGSELATRAGVGLLLIALAGGALIAGDVAFWVLLSVIGLLMMGEWADLVAAGPKWKRIAQYALSVPLAAMAPIAAGPGFFAFGLLLGAAFFIGAVSRREKLALGILYVGLPVLSLMLLRTQADGLLLTFWAMALVWACDSGAYFVGRAIGGPKLAPSISPGKTWAGFWGGLLAAALFGVALHWLFRLGWTLAAATPLLAALSQLGDLYESRMKRLAGVKDSGNLLPGHGGFMDRLDGLVPVAPAAALLVLLLRAVG